MRLATVAVTGAIVAASVVGPAAAASAHSRCPYGKHCRPAVAPVAVTKATTPTATYNSSTLPFTGADIAGLSIAGVAALGAGAGLTVAGRRRKSARI